jgi:hypothetical protein
MDYGQLKLIVEEAVNNAINFHWWLYLLILLIAAAGAFLGSYLKKKAEHLATKEDIEEITKKVEDIRTQYSEQLESHKASLQLSNQLKLAALDKRLQKHQEAYSLWRRLLFNLRNEEKIGQSIDECQRWWDENCLYLGDEARSAFHSAIFLAVDFRNIPRTDSKEIQEWFRRIKAAGDRIIEAVNLPSLGEDEIKPIKPEEES